MADIIFPGESPSSTLGATKLPSNVDLSIWKGDAQEYLIKLESTNTDGTKSPIDLTGCTAQAVIRQDFSATTTYPFTCTVTNATGGEVKVYLSSADSKNIPAGDYVWNFQITAANGDVRTYLAGDVKVHAEVD